MGLPDSSKSPLDQSPVPVRATVGFCPPLVLMVRVAESDPVADGLNSTGNVQLLPGATPEVQVLPVLSTVKLDAFVPVIAVPTESEEIVPTFEIVRSSVLVVPWVMVPKAMLVAETLTSDVAVPESEITGLEPPLVVKVRVPLLLPTAEGSYSMGSTQLAPPARLDPQVFPVLEIENPAPEIASESVKEAVPTLETVRFDVFVVP